MTQDLELAHEIAGAALGMDRTDVEVGPEVFETLRWVREELPDDDEDGTSGPRREP